MAQPRLFDVSRDERRSPDAGRALCGDVEPELRGAPRVWRSHALGEPCDGGSGGGRRAFHRCPRDAEERAMKAFTKLLGVVVPLDRANVDTDQIIPKQFLKSIRRTGFGENLFDAWRFHDEGSMGQTPNERKINREFVL